MIPCTSCKTSYNVLRQFVGAGGGGGGSGVVDAFDIRGWVGGGVVQNRESPDFRSPEVGRYALCTMCNLLLNVIQYADFISVVERLLVQFTANFFESNA